MFSHCVFNAFLGDLSHILVTVIIYAGNEVTCVDSVVPWIGADGDRGENRFPARLDIHVLDDLWGRKHCRVVVRKEIKVQQSFFNTFFPR